MSYNYLLVFLVIVSALIITITLSSVLIEFFRKLRYINDEINRTVGREQKHWRKKKKRLLLSLIPFLKYFMKE